MHRRRKVAAATVLLMWTAVACSGESTDDGKAGDTNRSEPRTTVAVLASASLSDVLAELGRRFEATRPGTKVDFSFSATSELAERVRTDWPADLLFAADEDTVPALVAEGHAADSRVFGRNELTILVAKGNPKGVRSLADLARPDVRLVLCAVEAPCGRLSAKVVSRAGLSLKPKSYEANTRGLVAKLVFAEADAGIAFTTNALDSAEQLDRIDIPAEQNVAAAYPMARLRQAKQPALANDFTAFVLSDQGRQVLAQFGVSPP